MKIYLNITFFLVHYYNSVLKSNYNGLNKIYIKYPFQIMQKLFRDCIGIPGTDMFQQRNRWI